MDIDIIVIDTETTGLGAQHYREDAIVQIGAVVVRDGIIIDEFSSCCWPGEKYFLDGRAGVALAINNLGMSELRSSPMDGEVAEEFRRWLLQYLPARITAYNIAFDRPFLEQEPWELHEIDGLEWGGCIMLYAAEYLGDKGLNKWNHRFRNWKWPKLGEAAVKLGVEMVKAHDAAGDARTATEVMLKMKMDV